MFHLYCIYLGAVCLQNFVWYPLPHGETGNPVSPFYMRQRVVSNFGDGDCGAGEIHNFEDTRREGSAEDIRKLDPH